MPFLSMIVMIKGIYLITGLLNYSSVEARLFRGMLIAYGARGTSSLSAAPRRQPVDQRLLKLPPSFSLSKKKKAAAKY